MKVKLFILTYCILLLAACNNDAVIPTSQPTAVIPTPVPTATLLTPDVESTAEPVLSTETESTQSMETPTAVSTLEADPELQEIDQEVCQQAMERQAELETLQEQGQDVTVLVTAVAELVGELSQCESFYTPTPFSE